MQQEWGRRIKKKMGIMSETIRRMGNRSTMSRRLKESWDPAGAGVDDDDEEEEKEEGEKEEDEEEEEEEEEEDGKDAVQQEWGRRIKNEDGNNERDDQKNEEQEYDE